MLVPQGRFSLQKLLREDENPTATADSASFAPHRLEQVNYIFLKAGYLLYIEDYTTQLYRDKPISHDKDPAITGIMGCYVLRLCPKVQQIGDFDPKTLTFKVCSCWIFCKKNTISIC